MKDKLGFLQLEDNTVYLVKDENVNELFNRIPDTWNEIITMKSKEERCKAVIELWEKYLGDRLPNVMNRFHQGLVDVEILGRYVNGEKRYSLLYSILDDDQNCIYFEGRNPMNNISYRAKLEYWDNIPQQIRFFYENIHDGFYHYLNRGMGLQPIMFTHFFEPQSEEVEWDLNFENYDIENSHQIAFFWNNLGLAVSLDGSLGSEKNAIIWRSDYPPEFHVDFWDIVDQLLLYF